MTTAYDALGRVTGKSYTMNGAADAATPDVAYSYYTDSTVPFSYGRLPGREGSEWGSVLQG